MTLTAAQGWARLPEWQKQILYMLDRRLNARTGGNPAETVSERLAHDQAAGGWRGRFGCQLLDRVDPGHCDRILTKDAR